MSIPISRWLTIANWSLWTNSIGSSMVMMLTRRFLLITSTIAASVVVFPHPVGPVTSTRPLRLRQNSWPCRDPSSSSVLIWWGSADRRCSAASLVVHVHPDAEVVSNPERQVHLIDAARKWPVAGESSYSRESEMWCFLDG